MENIFYDSLPSLSQNGLVDATCVEIPCGGYSKQRSEPWTLFSVSCV